MLFQRQQDTLIVHAPAKLNLLLQVKAKRPDGFHEIETLMVTVGLYDTLRLSDDASGQIALRCRNAGSPSRSPEEAIPTGADNLVIRAAQILREHTGASRGAHIDLFKRIPAAAGLAGGSSDAAATLAGLNRLWDLGLANSELMQLAAKLGSDIPFFLAEAPAAVCRGRGELIEPFRSPLQLHFVIVRPETGLSTAEVYRHCRPSEGTGEAEALARMLSAGRLKRAASLLYNGLQLAAEDLNADVRTLREAFAAQPLLGHLMSGSGTAYFGLCATRRQARTVAARLRCRQPGRVFTTQSRP